MRLVALPCAATLTPGVPPSPRALSVHKDNVFPKYTAAQGPRRSRHPGMCVGGDWWSLMLLGNNASVPVYPQGLWLKPPFQVFSAPEIPSSQWCSRSPGHRTLLIPEAGVLNPCPSRTERPAAGAWRARPHGCAAERPETESARRPAGWDRGLT